MSGRRSLRIRRLPIVFRALDVEEHTKPVPSLLCPQSGAMMTVGSCGRCAQFRRIELRRDGSPVLACMPEAVHPPSSSIQSLLRVPNLCVAQDTPIGEILPFLGRRSGVDPIPVLDHAARPVGLVDRTVLRDWIAHGRALSTPVASLMRTLVTRVLPETRITDATAHATFGACRDYVVVDADGTFLGLASRAKPAE